jgi:hypothetical protein
MMARRDSASNHWALNLLQPMILRQTQNLWEQPEVTRVAKAAGVQPQVADLAHEASLPS